MFSTREIKILMLLRENNFSGDVLASKLQTSRRTIVRDVISINEQLANERIGEITSAGVYHLHLFKPEKFNDIMAKNTDEKNRILAVLCCNQFSTLADLSDEFFLSKAAVQAYIAQIDEEYQEIFTIESKPGRGLQLKFKRLTPTDVLASCLFEYPKMLEHFNDDNHVMQLATKLSESLLNPYAQWLTSTQWRLQIFSCLVCTVHPNIGIQQFPVADVPGLTNDQRQKLATFLGKRVGDMQKLFSEKQDLLQTYNQLTSSYQLTAISLKTFEDVFNHLVREEAFPHPGIASLRGELQKLRIKNPIPFDFAQQFTSRLMTHYPDQWWDANYLALYVVQAINQRDTKPVRMLLYAPRPSLERINSTILQQHIKNMSLTMVTTIEEARALQCTANFDLTIANITPSMLNTDKLRFDFTFAGVITPEEIKLIEQLVNGRYYQDNLTAMLPPSHFKVLDRAKDFWSALQQGLQYFVDQNALSITDMNSLIEREREGNQLILQHVSIPHITSNTTDDYKLFAIILPTAIKLDVTSVNLIVVVLAGAAQIERNNIFSYFYQTLRRVNDQFPNDINSYQDVIQLLGGKTD